MRTHTIGMAVFAGMAIAFATAAGAGADETNRRQYLTFSRSVELPGVTLHAGTYVFELPDAIGAPDIVRVESRDRKTVYFTAYTRSISRPASVPSTQLVSVREVAPDQPVPITVWWSDERMGRQFVYER